MAVDNAVVQNAADMTKQGDWTELIGVNLKFYIQDDADSWDNLESDDIHWLKLFGGSNMYQQYNGLNYTESLGYGAGSHWFQSGGGPVADPTTVSEEGDYPDVNNFNYNMGGFYCRCNEGEGNFIKNVKNNSTNFHRTNTSNAPIKGNGIHDVYISGAKWGSDSKKRYIELTSMPLGQDSTSYTNSYESAARNGFITAMSPNNFEFMSQQWWAAGAIQEMKSFTPRWGPVYGDQPDGVYTTGGEWFWRPGGFDGINFHSWMEFPSPFDLLGYDPEAGTYVQDTVVLYQVYCQKGYPYDAAAAPWKGDSDMGDVLTLGLFRHGTEIKLQMVANTMRAWYGGGGFYDRQVVATFDKATQKLFNSTSGVAANSTKMGGFHHIQVQWLSSTNSIGVWIDGELIDYENSKFADGSTPGYARLINRQSFELETGMFKRQLGGVGNMFFVGSMPMTPTMTTVPFEGALLNEDTRFTGHFTGKIYDVALYGVCYSFANTNQPIDSNKTMQRINAIGLDNIPRGGDWVDFSDQFEMRGKNLVQSIGTIKQVIQGRTGQFYVSLNSVDVRNIDDEL